MWWESAGYWLPCVLLGVATKKKADASCEWKKGIMAKIMKRKSSKTSKSDREVIFLHHIIFCSMRLLLIHFYFFYLLVPDNY
mmetsp:Transcript_32534/g.36215  ORF Transcript_32534/g.36215 Transcript_32534/m.36215 type:complete len:82 (+) Transcript_32534:668-913(+)